MLLFPFADREILNLSGTHDALGHQRIVEELGLDLRFLTLMLPLDDFIVITPGHFLESPTCEDIVMANFPLLESGYLRLIRREPSHAEYIAKKREAYHKVREIPDYQRAYYSRDANRLNTLGFSVVPKIFSTGKESLRVCVQTITSRARQVGYDEQRVVDMIARIKDTEQNAFLWESAKRHLEASGIGRQDENLLQVRLAMSQAYVAVHCSSGGIVIPIGSGKVIPAHFSQGGTGRINVIRIRRFLEAVGIFTDVAEMSAGDLVELKAIPEIAESLARAGEALNMSDSTEETMRLLARGQVIRELRQAVGRFKSSSLASKGDNMDKAISQFKTDYPGQTVFVMTSFPKGTSKTQDADAKINTAFRFISSFLQSYGLTAVRADGKNYVAVGSNHLWDNVQVYLHACDYGIAILDNMYSEQMNVNVAMEYGYLRGLKKPTLLLKSKEFKNIPTDILGLAWKEFEFDRVKSIGECLDRWMVDLGKPKIIIN